MKDTITEALGVFSCESHSIELNSLSNELDNTCAMLSTEEHIRNLIEASHEGTIRRPLPSSNTNSILRRNHKLNKPLFRQDCFGWPFLSVYQFGEIVELSRNQIWMSKAKQTFSEGVAIQITLCFFTVINSKMAGARLLETTMKHSWEWKINTREVLYQFLYQTQ